MILIFLTFSQFYKGNDGLSKDYNLQEDNCKPGMYCAALYYGQWHRGFITKVDGKKRRCGVSYIDYGSIATLPMLGTIHILRKHFYSTKLDLIS